MLMNVIMDLNGVITYRPRNLNNISIIDLLSAFIIPDVLWLWL